MAYTTNMLEADMNRDHNIKDEFQRDIDIINNCLSNYFRLYVLTPYLKKSKDHNLSRQIYKGQEYIMINLVDINIDKICFENNLDIENDYDKYRSIVETIVSNIHNHLKVNKDLKHFNFVDVSISKNEFTIVAFLR